MRQRAKTSEDTLRHTKTRPWLALHRSESLGVNRHHSTSLGVARHGVGFTRRSPLFGVIPRRSEALGPARCRSASLCIVRTVSNFFVCWIVSLVLNSINHHFLVFCFWQSPLIRRSHACSSNQISVNHGAYATMRQDKTSSTAAVKPSCANLQFGVAWLGHKIMVQQHSAGSPQAPPCTTLLSGA